MASRRQFLINSIGVLGGASLLSYGCDRSSNKSKKNILDQALTKLSEHSGNIKISSVSSNFEREPLLSPFGFKGGYLSELWQVASFIKSESGNHSIGLGTQSVLWSDANVFTSHTESGGNSLMYAMTERALQLLKNVEFNNPLELIDILYEEIYDYGKKITQNSDLRKTFALNSLVSVDNALWLLYAKENNIDNFDDLIPDEFKATFSEKHSKLAAIPLISYNVSPEALRDEVDSGYFFMKIKIGQAGSQEEMLKKDMMRLSDIHELVKDTHTPYTENGKLPYYFDANGRYESKETFNRFLEHADSIGALEQIVLVEEPFPEDKNWDVSDIPVRLAADETAHTDIDTIERIQMGYKAIALKPIAKTLSMTMKIAKVASEMKIPCFCADLTVNPLLVDWNKNVAARLQSFPGLANLGLVESNGHQNYTNWDKMCALLPYNNESWVMVENGFYNTGEDFYRNGGGIFTPVPHYEEMFKNEL